MDRYPAHSMDRLRQLCRERRTTVAELIRLQATDPESVSGSHIRHVTTGGARPSPRVLRLLSRALQVEPAELVGPLP